MSCYTGNHNNVSAFQTDSHWQSNSAPPSYVFCTSCILLLISAQNLQFLSSPFPFFGGGGSGGNYGKVTELAELSWYWLASFEITLSLNFDDTTRWPCYLSIWSNPCTFHKKYQAGRATNSPSKPFIIGILGECMILFNLFLLDLHICDNQYINGNSGLDIWYKL